MIEILEKLGEVTVLAYVVSSMLVTGMSQRLGDVLAPLKEPRSVIVALSLNFVAAPLLAILLSRTIPLQPAHATGLLLLGAAAGAPFIPKLADVARGNLPYSVAIMLLLMVGSIVFVPVVLPFIVLGVSPDPVRIAEPLIFSMLFPLAIGFALNARLGRVNNILLPILRKLSNLTFLLLLLLLVGLNLQALYETLGSYAIGTYVLFVVAMVLLGYAVGGMDSRKRTVLALASGQRNISVALVVSVESLDDPAVVIMLLVGAVAGLVVLLGVARLLRADE